MGKPVNKYEFAQAKRWLMSYSVETTAKKLNRSIKTVVQIKNSKTFDDYQDQNLAQHPPTKFSLRDNVLELHRLLFDHDMYAAPSSAERAITELLEAYYEMEKENV